MNILGMTAIFIYSFSFSVTYYRYRNTFQLPSYIQPPLVCVGVRYGLPPTTSQGIPSSLPSKITMKKRWFIGKVFHILCVASVGVSAFGVRIKTSSELNAIVMTFRFFGSERNFVQAFWQGVFVVYVRAYIYIMGVLVGTGWKCY